MECHRGSKSCRTRRILARKDAVCTKVLSRHPPDGWDHRSSSLNKDKGRFLSHCASIVAIGPTLLMQSSPHTGMRNVPKEDKRRFRWK
jgi:hypothetical protein